MLLYTLVYGAMPFEGPDFKRLRKQITEGDFYEPANQSGTVCDKCHGLFNLELIKFHFTKVLLSLRMTSINKFLGVNRIYEMFDIL